VTKLKPISEIENSAVLIRAIYEHGPHQLEAVAELNRRGLWLTDEQKRQAGLTWLDRVERKTQ
jgi:hypothetical protein